MENIFGSYEMVDDDFKKPKFKKIAKSAFQFLKQRAESGLRPSACYANQYESAN